MKERKKLAAIVGGPSQAAVTVSPAMQNAAFRALGLDWLYLAVAVAEEEGAAAVRALGNLGFSGMNITMPHKISVLQVMDSLDTEARLIGAVNTVKITGEALEGFNTDGAALVKFLEEDLGTTVEGKRVLLIGSGGSARAAVSALCRAGAKSLTVLARDQLSGEALGLLAEEASFASRPLSASADAVGEADLIVNATPLGQRGEIVPIDYDSIKPDSVVVDLVYRPPVTPMVQAARDRGAIAHSGLGMLVRQAALSFEIWTGQVPPLGAMSAAAVAALKRG